MSSKRIRASSLWVDHHNTTLPSTVPPPPPPHPFLATQKKSSSTAKQKFTTPTNIVVETVVSTDELEDAKSTTTRPFSKVITKKSPNNLDVNKEEDDDDEVTTTKPESPVTMKNLFGREENHHPVHNHNHHNTNNEDDDSGYSVDSDSTTSVPGLVTATTATATATVLPPTTAQARGHGVQSQQDGVFEDPTYTRTTKSSFRHPLMTTTAAMNNQDGRPAVVPHPAQWKQKPPPPSPHAASVWSSSYQQLNTTSSSSSSVPPKKNTATSSLSRTTALLRTPPRKSLSLMRRPSSSFAVSRMQPPQSIQKRSVVDTQGANHTISKTSPLPSSSTTTAAAAALLGTDSHHPASLWVVGYGYVTSQDYAKLLQLLASCGTIQQTMAQANWLAVQYHSPRAVQTAVQSPPVQLGTTTLGAIVHGTPRLLQHLAARYVYVPEAEKQQQQRALLEVRSLSSTSEGRILEEHDILLWKQRTPDRPKSICERLIRFYFVDDDEADHPHVD